MKKLLFLIILFSIVFSGFTQNRTVIPKELQDFGVKYEPFNNSSYNVTQTSAPLKNTLYNSEEDIGMTFYDLQSMGSMQNRIHVFDDGTIGAVFTIGFDFPNFSDDRGTGYNYYDGSEWGSFPTEAFEEYRSGWPAYAPFGENGEIIVSHISSSEAEGLTFSKRENKGTGEWEQWIFQGPTGFENIHFPHMATGGVNNSTIHLLAATTYIPPYQGQEMALLYSRSNDGGITWSPENYILPEINANYYVGFDPDNFDMIAEGDNVAILIGGPWIDLLLLKSTDGGDNWEKTIIWEHPYPLFEYGNGYPTDSFYCVDGSHNLDFDNEGMVHVVFGINRTYSDGACTYWFPAVGGIGYWNESRPTFSNNINAINPYGHPDSELEENHSLVGWSPDINGNGQLDILDDWGTYYLGFSSMPQIHIDETDQILIVYSSVTEGYDNDLQSYRHLWARFSPNGTYWGPMGHLTSELVHIYDECVFPSLAYFNVGWFAWELVLLYQHDNEPGMAVMGDEDPYGENYITCLEYVDFFPGISNNIINDCFIKVSQNQPNPFKEKTTIRIKLWEPNNVIIKVTNLTGEKVFENNWGYLNSGSHNLLLELPSLKPGVYFYTVKSGEYSVTKKMIVK